MGEDYTSEGDYNSDDPIYLDSNDDEITMGNGDMPYCLILRNDRDRFVTKIRIIVEASENVETSAVWLSTLLSIACNFGAVNIVKALLEGELGLAVDVNYADEYGMCPLHNAVMSGSFSMVEMLLHHGARTDMRCNFPSLTRKGYNNLSLVYESKLPLEAILLKHGEDSYLHDWSPNESISYLLFLLCLPAQKDLFDIIRLLVLNTEEVEELICRCALEGKIVEFALLLLAAQEKVMAPFMIRSTEDSDSNASTTIRQCIMHAIAKQAEEDACNCKTSGGRSSNFQLQKHSIPFEV